MPTPVFITAAADDADTMRRAVELTNRLHLPLVAGAGSERSEQLHLIVRPDRLELADASMPRQAPIYVDFLSGSVAYRRVAAREKRELLARAIGDRERHGRMIDATAGLARDAFLLAALGYEVTAIERWPVLSALVEDALRRASAANDPTLTTALSRLRLVTADSAVYLSQLTNEPRPDVIYLDPMYETVSGSALAKKEMRVLRKLVGDDPDSGELLRIARSTARRRVVVKRHRHAPPLELGVSHEIVGTSVRYDVYMLSDNSQ